MIGGMVVAGGAGVGLGLVAGSRITGESSPDHDGDRVIGLVAGLGGAAFGAVTAADGYRAVARGLSTGAGLPIEGMLRGLSGAALLGGAIGLTLTASLF